MKKINLVGMAGKIGCAFACLGYTILLILAMIFSKEVDESKKEIVIFSIIFLLIADLILILWTIYIFLMQISINYEKQKVLIIYRYGIRSVNFEDINTIKIRSINSASEIFLATEEILINVKYKKFQKNQGEGFDEFESRLLSLPQKNIKKQGDFNGGISTVNCKLYRKSTSIYYLVTAIIMIFFGIGLLALDFYLKEYDSSLNSLPMVASVIFIVKFLRNMKKQIQINFNERYVYINHSGVNQKIEFENINKIAIVEEYDELSFKLYLSTDYFTKDFDFIKYRNQKITNEMRKEICELKAYITYLDFCINEDSQQ